MKTILIASLLLTAGAPLRAASLEDAPVYGRDARTSMGTFAGARARLLLGGERRDEKVHAGLTLSPMRVKEDGAARRFADGFEVGFTERRGVALSMAGYSLTPHRKLAAAQGGDDKDDRRGPSTALLVVGGVLIALGIGVALYIDVLNDASD